MHGTIKSINVYLQTPPGAGKVVTMTVRKRTQADILLDKILEIVRAGIWLLFSISVVTALLLIYFLV